jgi:myo-inositol 2-dehydrogenase / D-chiro-inositol 1-dehydrogenase
MDSVNVGVIGLGNQGLKHLINCKNLKNVRICGVADSSEKNLSIAKQFGADKLYASYEDLLKDKQIDAVIISLPNFLHFDCAVMAAEAGKHIMLEKPLARNPIEGESLLNKVNNAGVKLMLGYNARFDPFNQALNNKIKQGHFGEIKMAQATNLGSGPFTPRSDNSGPVYVPPWWFQSEMVGGGALLDLGSHLINLLRWFFGKVETVESYLGYQYNLEIEDIATCVLKFEKGPTAIVNAGWFSKRRMVSIQINGTADNFSKQMFPSSIKQTILDDIRKKLGIKTSDPNLIELNYFIECVKNDCKPDCNGEDGLEDLKVISKAYQNSKLRKNI